MSGPVHPLEEVLAELETRLATLRARIRQPDLAMLLLPDPTELFLWRVALTCRHNTETMTSGRAATGRTNYVTQRHKQVLCVQVAAFRDGMLADVSTPVPSVLLRLPSTGDPRHRLPRPPE